MSNEAATYGVNIQRTTSDGLLWRAVSVRHLSPAENRGRHHIYVDALDEQAQRATNPTLRIGWTWEGRGPHEVATSAALDKPANEPMGNIPMFWGQVVSIWIEGSDSAQGEFYPSDIVTGLHTAHPDEDAGNTTGHHSFHVTFQLQQGGEDTGGGPVTGPGFPTEPQPPVSDERIREVMAVLDRAKVEIAGLLRGGPYG